MSIFYYSYRKKDKPISIRKDNIGGFSLTFEKILFGDRLVHLCERNYIHPFDWDWLNRHVFIKRISANALICEYNVLIYDLNSNSKLLAEYIVEIECVENDGSVDILLQEQELHEPPQMIPKKEKLRTNWYINEPRAIRNFLLLVQRYGNVKDLKKSGVIGKATIYRHLQYCEEKGFIREGKLVKRLYVYKKK